MTAVSGRPKPDICPLPGRFWVNTLAQGVLRQHNKLHPIIKRHWTFMTTSVLLIISLSVKTTNAVHAHAEELKLIAKHRYTIFLSNISKIWHALTCKLVNVFLQKKTKKKHYFTFLQRKTEWLHCSYSTSSLLQKSLQVTAAWCEGLQPNFSPDISWQGKLIIGGK